MAQPIRVPTDDQPTIWNREAALGAAIGLVAFPVGPIIGCLIGGFIGKSRMSKELEVGKRLDPPTLFNSTMFMGAFMGTIISLAMSFGGLAAMVAGVFGGSGAAVATGAGLLGLGVFGGTLLGGVIGGVAGAFMGKSRMHREYQEGLDILGKQVEQKAARSRGAKTPQMMPAYGAAPVIQNPYVNSVTPQEAAMMNAQFAQGAAQPGASFRDKVMQERYMAQMGEPQY